jgi:membrane protein
MEAIEELAIHLADFSISEQDNSVLLRYFSFGFQHIIQSQLFDYFPAQRNALEYMLGFVDQYLDQMKGGVFVGIGLCFLLWTLISLLSNIEKAFNDIWQVQGGRSFYRKVTDYTSMFLILPILMVASSGFSLFMSTMLSSSVLFLSLR